MLQEMLNFYGYETFEDFMGNVGLRQKDAERILLEMYEEDTAPEQ